MALVFANALTGPVSCRLKVKLLRLAVPRILRKKVLGGDVEDIG
jgi:hypothetical protein